MARHMDDDSPIVYRVRVVMIRPDESTYSLFYGPYEHERTASWVLTFHRNKNRNRDPKWAQMDFASSRVEYMVGNWVEA